MAQASDKSSSNDEPSRKSTTGQALYRGYRPKSFDEVVGQDHIVSTLKKAIKSGRISHAYLFTGPRGVGKTSVARILAHEVNGLPYTDESIHLDIIEIDAASNRRIDEIRELRDKVHISPTSAKYKVYIIDEVHMLTREAFNALLKTLEEPPEHVIFILATTEAHKLPETIVSRTQRFEFKPIGASSAVGHLAAIAKSEQINIDKTSLELLAEHGQGSFRDSIGLLDQLAVGRDKITEADIRDFLGLPPASIVNDLADAIASGDSPQALELLDSLRNQGSSAEAVAKLLGQNLRQKFIISPGDKWIADLLRQLIEVPASARAWDNLEIAALESCAHNASGQAQPTAPAAKPSQPARITPEQVTKIRTEPAAPNIAIQEKPAKKTAAPARPIDEAAWEEIVKRVKDQAASIYTALRLATPEASDGKLTLAFQFPLHQKKIDQAEHKDLIGRIVAEVTGQDVTIEPVVDKTKKPVAKAPAPEPAKATKPADPKDKESLDAISNIFGTAEVLES